MRKLWRHFLALTLGLSASGAYAQEVAWKPVASSPAAALGAPIASTRPAAPPKAPITAAEPAAVIGRPIAIASSRQQEAKPPLAPAVAGPVARGSSALTTDGQPVVSPGASGVYPGMHTWRRADEGVMLTSRTVAADNGPLPAPTPSNGSMAPMPVGPSTNAPHGGPILIAPSNGIPSLYATAPSGPYQPYSPNCGAPPCPAPCAVAPCPAPACCAPAYAPTCGAPACGCGNVCPPGNIWFVGIEYLMWTMKGDVTPALVTSNPTTFPSLGPGTTVLFGGRGLGDQTTSGARLTVGMWFSDAHCWGLEASGFFLGQNTDHFSATSLGNTNLGRPFTNFGAFRAGPAGLVPNVPGTPFAEVVGNTTGTTGRVDVDRTNRLWGADFNVVRGLCCSDCGYVNLLFGFRTLGLDENLRITENIFSATSATTGTRFQVQDQFHTTNRFYGGQVGFDSLYRWGDWSFGARGKLGLGVTQQMSELSGSTFAASVPPGAVLSAPGGLLVQPGTNMGTHFRHPFTVVPELGLTVGYQLRPWMRVTLGYNFLYWSNVIRPGGTIDTGVNTAYLPGLPAGVSARTPGSPFAFPARPGPSFNGNDFWAQGLTLGLAFTF
jgi:hypothetical protein